MTFQFDKYLTRWYLIPDGDPVKTEYTHSQLLPVRYQGKPAILKIATSSEERWGAKLMVWWNGNGAAKIFLHDDDALLMERAVNHQSLIEMARTGQDDEASRIICSVAAKLHAQNANPPPLTPLSQWFNSLDLAAAQHGGIFKHAFQIAQELLAHPQEMSVLHGDLHHGNILDFGERGWLAIDPKHIFGERGFDFANIFCNPDMEIAIQPGRLLRQVNIVSEAAQLEKKRLLKWIVAYAGLSAAWSLEDHQNPGLALKIAEISASKL